MAEDLGVRPSHSHISLIQFRSLPLYSFFSREELMFRALIETSAITHFPTAVSTPYRG